MLTIIIIAVFHTKKSSRAWIAVFSRRVCPSIVTQVHDVIVVMMVMMVMVVVMMVMVMMVMVMMVMVINQRHPGALPQSVRNQNGLSTTKGSSHLILDQEICKHLKNIAC